jgi:hypothetical protein
LLIAQCARYNVCMAANGPIGRALPKLQAAIRAAPMFNYLAIQGARDGSVLAAQPRRSQARPLKKPGSKVVPVATRGRKRVRTSRTNLLTKRLVRDGSDGTRTRGLRRDRRTSESAES